MIYRFRASERFWRNFHALPPNQKESTRKVWLIFRENPFGRRLRTHKIEKLSSNLKRTVYAVEIEADLRAIFYIERDVVYTVNIGAHAVYKQ